MIECPSCGKSGFENSDGMKSHHKQVHGESLAGFEYECTECGESFTRESKLRGDEPFCSIQCLTENQKDRKTVECEICGEIFELPVCKANNRKTCGKECWSEYMSRYLTGRRSGSDHPQWVDDVETNYGDGWNEIRENILSRDNYKCILCGKDSDKSKEKHGFGLHVHHVRPIRTFGSREDANGETNLVTLCLPCHRKVESYSVSEQLSIFVPKIESWNKKQMK